MIFRYEGFRFFFYSNEGHPREPKHIHVQGQGCEAKFWIEPAVSLAKRDGFDAKTLHLLQDAVADNVKLLVWFPRLLNASTVQCQAYELSASGIHWDAIDEDISIEGLLAGRGDVTAKLRVAA